MSRKNLNKPIMQKLLLLSTLCLALNLSAQNNPPNNSPIHQQISDLRKQSIVNLDDFVIKPEQLKPSGRLSASLTTQRKSPTDAIQLQDSTYNWLFDQTNWLFTSKTTNITYDANYNLSGFTDADWDGLNWVNTTQYAYTYDANNNPLTSIRRTWDGQEWQNDQQRFYGYDANNNTLSILIQDWNGTDWVGYLRYTYTYNENNDETSRLIEQWNNDAWENYLQIITTYDPNYNPIHVLSQSWQDNAWENTQQTTTTYNEQHYPFMVLVESWNGDSWVNTFQSGHLYDDNNNVTSEVFLSWNGFDWKGISFYTYTYDTNNNMITQLYQTDDNGVWVNNEYTTSTYDQSNNLITALLQGWDGFGWQDIKQFFYTYDGHDNLISYDIQEWWGEWYIIDRYTYHYDDNNFQNYYAYKAYDLDGVFVYGDSTHFYYRTITAIGDILPDSDQIMISPNPANDLITISSENEINGISVFNLLGKKIYATEKTSDLQTNEMDISTWPAGIYLVQIKEGDRFFTKKLVVQ
jgi:hypothetical protein